MRLGRERDCVDGNVKDRVTRFFFIDVAHGG